ncbi:MAG: DoxX family protein [Flavobacteriaceae bacterium]|nr:DoxX family protein [Flavobacteriaceae bacterium]
MNLNTSLGILTTRLIIGFVFLMQGIGKVFTWGVENMYKMDFFYEKYKELLPDFVIHFTAYYTSYIELIAGALLVIGFKRDYALYGLASVLIIVTFGHGLTSPVWILSDVIYRAIPIVVLLLLPREWDVYTLDNLLGKKSSK